MRRLAFVAIQREAGWSTMGKVKVMTEDELKTSGIEGRRTPYFRRIRGKTEDGYPQLEWGYCIVGEGFRVVAKAVVSQGADIIWLIDANAVLRDPNYNSLNGLSIDVTADGYWCILHGGYQWDTDWLYSTAKLVHGRRE